MAKIRLSIFNIVCLTEQRDRQRQRQRYGKREKQTEIERYRNKDKEKYRKNKDRQTDRQRHIVRNSEKVANAMVIGDFDWLELRDGKLFCSLCAKLTIFGFQLRGNKFVTKRSVNMQSQLTFFF